MGSRKSVSSGHVRTREEAKAALQAEGITLKQFAATNRLSYRIVSEVVRGVNKGLYGEGHKAAVALGIK